MKKRILLAAGLVALAACAPAEADTLCKDVPGCLELERQHNYHKVLTDKEFQYKLREMEQEMIRKDYRHETEIQSMREKIDEVNLRRVELEAKAKAIAGQCQANP